MLVRPVVKSIERRMKFVAVLTALCAIANNSVVAQENPRLPRKFVEYSKCRTDISGCESDESEWAVLDSVGNLLKSDLSVHAYVIGYSGRSALFGSGIVHANYARNLLRRWVAEDSRVRAVYGGRREHLTIEVWIVPDMSSLPRSTPTISLEQASANTAQKFYEYQHPYVDRISLELFSEHEYLNQPAILDGLAALLEKEFDRRAYIITYDGRRDRNGTAYKLAVSDRFYLAMESNIASERITLVNGGRRENRTVELWVVPSGAAAPKPTPSMERKINRGR